MRILVEFKDPNTKEEHEFEMEGPEMDPDDLKEMVVEALEEIMGTAFPKNFDLTITEIASGTIH